MTGVTTSGYIMESIIEVTSFVLSALLGVASVVLLCCALASYVDVWRASGDFERMSTGDSLFVSEWFFYLNAFVCFMTLLGLILCV